MFIYSIYDTLGNDFLPLFESKNDDCASRDFVRSFKNEPELMKDYKLYRVGETIREVSEAERLEINILEYYIDVTPGVKDGRTSI